MWTQRHLRGQKLRCKLLARKSAKLLANFSATKVTSLPSLSLSPSAPHAQYRKRFRASYYTTTMGQCQAISTSQSVALENHQYDRPMDLSPKPEILNGIHYWVPIRSSAMTKTKNCFQTQTRQVSNDGRRCKWSELHAWSEPLRATIPVRNGARSSWDRWIKALAQELLTGFHSFVFQSVLDHVHLVHGVRCLLKECSKSAAMILACKSQQWQLPSGKCFPKLAEMRFSAQSHIVVRIIHSCELLGPLANVILYKLAEPLLFSFSFSERDVAMKLFDRLSKNPPESTGRPRTKSKEEGLGRRPRYACFPFQFLVYFATKRSFWSEKVSSWKVSEKWSWNHTTLAKKKTTIIEMGLVRITSWYPNFNGSHFGLPPSEIHRMTGLPPKIVWTMTYLHRAHSRREERWHHAWLGAISVGQVRSVAVRDFCPALIAPDRAWYHMWNSVLLATNLEDGSFFVQVVLRHAV